MNILCDLPCVTTMDGQQHDSTIQESQRNDDVAAAIERRLQQQREQAEEAAAAAKVETSFDENYERRQEFRRLIDPGIVRPNAKELALESLQVSPRAHVALTTNVD